MAHWLQIYRRMVNYNGQICIIIIVICSFLFYRCKQTSKMVSAILSRVVILVFGTLYPAYKSYKAVKTKNVKEYVKWMMYWIVFALFTCIETFTDLFVAWLPFYYELKILFVLWLLSPATKGASILYRKFVHPQLSKREQDIDAHIEKVTDQGYTALVSLGQKGFQYATNVVISSAIKGQAKIADQLKRSYSMSDVSTEEEKRQKQREVEEYTEDEDETDNRLIEESYRQEMHEEKDVDTAQQPSRRKKARTKEELEDIEEDTDAARTSKKQSHKEVSPRKSPKPQIKSSSADVSCPSSPRLRRTYIDKTPSSSAPGSPFATPRTSPGGFHYGRYVRSFSSGTSPVTSSREYPSSESSGNTSPTSSTPSSPWRSRSTYAPK